MPLNTVFGVVTALLIVRKPFRGKSLLNALIDLPFAVSPVVVGPRSHPAYGDNSDIGGWLVDNGVEVIFTPLGMVIATIFVSLPFVVREVSRCCGRSAPSRRRRPRRSAPTRGRRSGR